MNRPPLRPSQEEGIRRALEKPGFCLFMEQRTGKTRPSLEIARRRSTEKLLITCPKVAIDVWKKALAAEPERSARITRIVTHESLWGMRKELKRWNPDGVIGDETHRLKNPHSKRSSALRSIARKSRWRLALTGTPQGQGIQDYWAQFDFINPAIFGLWGDFQDRYLIFGGYQGHEIIGTQNVDEFQQKLHENSYRVLLEEIQPVPTRIRRNVVKFDLVESRAAYDSMLQKFIVQLNAEKRVVAPRVITQVMKLHQLSGGFIIDEEGGVNRLGDEKLTHLGALLLELHEPVVIIVKFIPEMRRIAALCRALGRSVTLVSGKNKFKDFETDVCIIQIQSGLAIDLARATEAIFYSMNHSYLDFDQVKFRIRAFDTQTVRYHFLMARGTVDEDIYDAVEGKKSLSSLILDKYRRR